MNILEIGSDIISYSYSYMNIEKKISIKSHGLWDGEIDNINEFERSINNLFTNHLSIYNNEPIIIAHHLPIYYIKNHKKTYYSLIDINNKFLYDQCFEIIESYDQILDTNKIISAFPLFEEHDNIFKKFIDINYIQPGSSLHYFIYAIDLEKIDKIKSIISSAGFNVYTDIPASLCVYNVLNIPKNSNISILSISCSNTNLLSYREGILCYCQTISGGICSLQKSISEALCIDMNRSMEIISSKLLNTSQSNIYQDGALNNIIELFISNIMNIIKAEILKYGISDNLIITGHGGLIPNISYIANKFFNNCSIPNQINANEVYMSSIYNLFNDIEAEKSNQFFNNIFLI